MSEFDPSEYSRFDEAGRGTVEGQAFMRRSDGSVVFGAGREVHMEPVSSYSTEWFERGVLGDARLIGGDPRVAAYHRSTQADGEGRFRFDGLPAGDYYITCRIEWYRDEWHKTGGIAHARVTVRDGQVTRAVVTR